MEMISALQLWASKPEHSIHRVWQMPFQLTLMLLSLEGLPVKDLQAQVWPPRMEALDTLKTFRKKDAMRGSQVIREYGIPLLSFSLFPGLAYECSHYTYCAGLIHARTKGGRHIDLSVWKCEPK